MKIFDHGISRDDIEAFQAKLLNDALENAHVWSCLGESDLKDEIRDDIMENLVSCYTLSMWAQSAYPEPEPDHEPIEDD